MSKMDNPLFSYSFSGAGRKDSASVHLCMYEEVAPGIHQVVFNHTTKVDMDSESYNAHEWITEVVTGLLESL